LSAIARAGRTASLGQGEGERDWEFVLGGKSLQLKNKSVYPPQEKNLKGDVPEDLALLQL